METNQYSALMGEQSAHLTLKLDTDEPIEIGDFVGAFTSIANEFERHIASSLPGIKVDPKFYVREVRSGCVEADIITGITASAAFAAADKIMLFEDFIRRWGARFTSLIKGNVPDGELATTSELNDFYRAAQTIATDPIASHRLEAAVYEDGVRKVRAVFKFSSTEARTAQQNINDRKLLLSKPELEPKRRVLMIFTRTDIHDASINKKSGERVLIADLFPKDRAVMYASELVEQEIRQHIRDADENVYKRGFVVDVLVQMSGQNIAAYSVTKFHSVIDID
ncbi:hypothetical protein [Brucella sp. 2280]|uniref:hypothetical protein n=1 Tax=Brucella sp. 2280 TaxID=2592625 RepID=UPI0012964504|nr:hypothetical protein [Brucella sp. 2280]QGA55896.1 hypothetical protein GHC20_01840 [Brucella sp. 2280]